MAAKMFVIAGPVLVFGLTASVVYGVLLVLFGGAWKDAGTVLLSFVESRQKNRPLVHSLVHCCPESIVRTCSGAKGGSFTDGPEC